MKHNLYFWKRFSCTQFGHNNTCSILYERPQNPCSTLKSVIMRSPEPSWNFCSQSWTPGEDHRMGWALLKQIRILSNMDNWLRSWLRRGPIVLHLGVPGVSDASTGRFHADYLCANVWICSSDRYSWPAKESGALDCELVFQEPNTSMQCYAYSLFKLILLSR